jgi:hypothetical protein
MSSIASIAFIVVLKQGRDDTVPFALLPSQSMTKAHGNNSVRTSLTQARPFAGTY